MNKIICWLIIVVMVVSVAGCVYEQDWSPRPIATFVRYVTAVPSITPAPWQPTKGPIAIATALRLIAPTATPTSIPDEIGTMPTPLPDYIPGRGMALLIGKSPYQVSILRGGWQAYQIGAASSGGGYLVDITPLEPAVVGAHVEYKVLPEFNGSQWVDVLWLRSPEITDSLDVMIDLIPTEDWQLVYQQDVRLIPGDWMGFAMFPNGEGCGGVLDIDIADTTIPPLGSYIEKTRVQPEFPEEWLQIARVQLSPGSASQGATLRYYTPGSQAEEIMRFEETLSPGVWSGWQVANSQARQGYIVEVIAKEATSNEITETVVQPEFNGTEWQDVLRLYVPVGRPRFIVLVRVLATPVP